MRPRQAYLSHEVTMKLRPAKGMTHLDFNDERARLLMVDRSKVSIALKRRSDPGINIVEEAAAKRYLFENKFES